MADITVGEQIGLNCVLAYNTGTHASPTWVTISRAKDVNIPLTRNEATISSRDSVYSYTKSGLLNVSIEFGYNYKRGSDSVWTALQANAVAADPTPIEFWAGDDLITLVGAKGRRFYGNVTEFSQDQPLEDGVVQRVVVKPTPYYVSGTRVDPDLYTIS